MISRRKFVCLLAGLPFLGRALVLGKKLPPPPPFLPPGFVQCGVCGEYNGSTDEGNLGLGKRHEATGHLVTVKCLCQGIPCKFCGRLKHRPISNSYEPETNSIGHWPYFVGWFGCGECERKRQAAWDNMPKAEKRRRIANQNRELEDLGFKRVSESTWIRPAHPKGLS